MTQNLEEQKTPLKEVIKGAKGEMIVLQDYNKTKEELAAKADKFKDLVVGAENLKEGKEARAELREIRYGLQNIEKHNNGLINEAKAEMKAAMTELIECIKPTEDKIHKQIKVIEDEKKKEKERKAQEEIKRVADINKKISDYKLEFEKLVSFGRTDEDIKAFCSLIDKLAEEHSQDVFQEFGFEVDNLMDDYNVRLNSELRPRVEKIKEDEKREEENRKMQTRLARQNELLKLGLTQENEHWFYKGVTVHTTGLLDDSDSNYQDGLQWCKSEIQRIDKIEAEQKAKEEAEKKRIQEEEEKRKNEENRKIQAEKEELAKQKAEHEARVKKDRFLIRKKRLEDLGFVYTPVSGGNYNFHLEGVWSMFHEQVDDADDEGFEETIKQINEAITRFEIEKANKKKEKEEAERKAKIEEERQFNELTDKARKLAVSFEGLNMEGDKTLIVSILKQRIEAAEAQLTREKQLALLEAGKTHVSNLEPLIKGIHTYFEDATILKEHESFTIEFEDSIREAFKALKKSIS